MMSINSFSEFLVFAGIMFVSMLIAGFGKEVR